MTVTLQEQSGIEPEWEFIDASVHSPSVNSQMSLEDVLSSPQAAIQTECERSASNASYSSNDATFSPGLPSSWSQPAGMRPDLGVLRTRRTCYGERQQRRSANLPGPPHSNPATGYAATTPIATEFRAFGPRPVVTNASGGRAYAPNDPQFAHVDRCSPYFGFSATLPDPLLPDMSGENVTSQISPSTTVAYSEPFELQGASLGGWSPPEPSSSSHSFNSNDIFWPALDLNEFENALAFGTVPPPYIDPNDSVSTFLDPLPPNLVLSKSSHSGFNHVRDSSETQSFVPSFSNVNDFRDESQRYHTQAPHDPEDADSKSPINGMPHRPVQKSASSSKSVPSSRQTQTASDPPVGSKGMVFFEEVLTPNHKGKPRRTQERQSQQRVAKRAGGRVLGTHLDQETLQHTNRLRQIGACWICRFQRDKCLDIGGVTCGPCSRRQNSTHFQNEHSLGCDRTNIVTYREDLLPGLMTAHFKQQALEDFAQKNIGYCYREKSFLLRLRWDISFPCIETETYEFEPKSPKMLQQLQYYRNRQNEWVRELRACPPLAMVRTPREESYEKYVDNVVDNDMQKFIGACFMDATNDFQKRLLEHLYAFRPSIDHKELRTVFRFLVTRLLVTRTWSMPDDTRDEILSQMQSYQPGTYGNSCSPRMANKQIKSCFNALHSGLLHKLLGSYQEILRKSGGKWSTAFIMVLVLAMVTEDCQKMMHATAEENAALGYYSKEAGEHLAVYLAQNQDDKWYHIMSLFRAKFTARGFNPFRDGGLKKLREKNKIDPEEVRLVQAVNNLMIEKSDFLHGRQHVPIAYANHGQYTSRLVARFLLHFWSDPS